MLIGDTKYGSQSYISRALGTPNCPVYTPISQFSVLRHTLFNLLVLVIALSHHM